MNRLRIPVNRLTPNGVLPHWLALGPFPNFLLERPLPDGTERGGLDYDYLTGIGGEGAAQIDPNSRMANDDSGNQSTEFVAQPRETYPNGNLELATLFPGSQYHVAYAHCYLESETEQAAYAYFGSKDGAKVWVNGALVHRVWSRRRAVRPWTECFQARLRKGTNRVLVKVENSGNEWAFILQLFREADHLAAVHERVQALSLELERYAFPNRASPVPLRVRTLPPTLLPPIDVQVQAAGPDGEPWCSARELTERSLQLHLPGGCKGFVVLKARLADPRFTPVQGRTWVYLGDLQDLRRKIAHRLDQLDLRALESTPSTALDPWYPTLMGLVDFARHWLRSGAGADTDWDLRLLRDFESLAEALEGGDDYLAQRLGRLHPVRREPSVSESAPVQYLLYLPRGYGDPGCKWPLVVFMSGAGAVGSDIQRLTQHNLIHRLLRDRDYPLPVVAPQCPAGRDWNAREPKHLDAFLDEICSRLPIDPERIILTGLSMGARAAWEWAAARPNRFAAVAPICGRLDPTIAARLIRQPLWIWHGDCDGTVPIYYAELAVGALRKAGAQVRCSVVEGEGHDAWDHAYMDPGLLRWMQSSRRTSARDGAMVLDSNPATGLSPTGFRTDAEAPWCFLQIECGDRELHRVLYVELIRLYGLLRTRAGLTADRLGFASVGEICRKSESRIALTLGLHLDALPKKVPRLSLGRLPRFHYAAADYRGPVQGIASAFDALSIWAEQQGKGPRTQRRLCVRYINRDVDYLDAELQFGVSE